MTADMTFYMEALARHNLRVVTPPATEPVSLVDARLHLRVDADGSPATHPDDSLIEALVTAAREYCEAYTGRALAAQTLELGLSKFPTASSVATSAAALGTPVDFGIALPMSPVQSISSVTYVDADGVTQTVATSVYELDVLSDPARLTLTYGSAWPVSSGARNSVKVRYAAGYGAEADESPLTVVPFPRSIRAAMLLLVGHWYENREAVNVGNITTTLDLAVASLLNPYTLRLRFA